MILFIWGRPKWVVAFRPVKTLFPPVIFWKCSSNMYWKRVWTKCSTRKKKKWMWRRRHDTLFLLLAWYPDAPRNNWKRTSAFRGFFPPLVFLLLLLFFFDHPLITSSSTHLPLVLFLSQPFAKFQCAFGVTIIENDTHQQSCTEVKILKELRDEDVDVHHSELVNLLHLPQNVQQPLKMALTSGDPYEV